MVALVATAAKAVGGYVFGLTGSPLAGVIASSAVVGTAYIGVQLGLNAISQAQLPDPEVGKLSLKQPRPYRKVAMGLPSRFGGAYMHWEAVDSTFGIVIALHDGRLASISDVYLHDDLVTLDGSGWVQEGADGRYGTGDLVQIKTRLGLATETHYSEMTSKFSATWPTAARGDGIASLMMLATHRSRESFPKHFPNGEPIPSVVGQGVCYDWRDLGQDRDDETTWGPCANPIVWLVHHEWFRCGMSWDRCIAPVLDDLTAEADYCDDLVDKVGGTEARYEFGGNYPANVQPQVRRQAMLAACDGWMSTDAKGRLVIKAGRYVEPTYTLTGDHIVGYEWAAGQTEETRVNKLIVSYLDPSLDYTETEADPWVDQDDLDAGAVERDETLQLQWVQSRSQARRLAKRKMSRLKAARRGQIVTDLSGLNGWGQRYIRVQNPELSSMADVVCEVMGAEFDPMSGTCVFDVILADEAIDEWDPDTEEGNAAGGATRPPPVALQTPEIVNITPTFVEGSARLVIDATGPARPDLTWFYRWRETGGTTWVEGSTTDVDDGSAITLETALVPVDTDLDVQVAYLTGAGRQSDWSATETVSTSTAALAPGTPTGLTAYADDDSPPDIVVSCSAPTSANVADVLFYLGGSTDDFEDAVAQTPAQSASPGELVSQRVTDPASGTYRLWAVARNVSAVASSPAGPVEVVIP